MIYNHAFDCVIPCLISFSSIGGEWRVGFLCSFLTVLAVSHSAWDIINAQDIHSVWVNEGIIKVTCKAQVLGTGTFGRSLTPLFPSWWMLPEHSSQEGCDPSPFPCSPPLGRGPNWDPMGLAGCEAPEAVEPGWAGPPRRAQSRAGLLEAGPLGLYQTQTLLVLSPSTAESSFAQPMPIGLLLVLLYTLLGNWPVFAYLPPLGHFTTLCNRPCSLWCTSGLDLACQSPFCKESQYFPQQSPGRTPRLWLYRPPWCWTTPAPTPSTSPALILSLPEPPTPFCQQCVDFKPEDRETLRRKRPMRGQEILEHRWEV